MKIRLLGISFVFALIIGIVGTVVTQNQGIDILASGKQIIKDSCSLIYMTESEIILDSNLIVQGELVKYNESKWSNPDLKGSGDICNILQTDIIFKIDDVLYGSYDKEEVTVRINSGEDKDTVIINNAYPVFKVGEKVLLFLSREVPESVTYKDEDYFILTGAPQGVYKGQDDKYINAGHSERTLDISELKEKIKMEHEKNPDWKEQRKLWSEQTKINNRKYFSAD